MRQQDHCYKPAPRFSGKGPWYLGLELEFEAPDRELRDKGLAVMKAPRQFYAKRDGSLGPTGWELVTHPNSPELWLEQNPKSQAHPVGKFFRLVNELRELGYTSHDNGSCGLHIHISRTVFERKTLLSPYYNDEPLRRGTTLARSPRLYWFARLVNGALFARLSQREAGAINQWAQQVPMKLRDVGLETSKYRAVHVTAKTIEVRIFRGNMREDRIRKAVEAVIAAVEFAGKLTSKNYRDDLDAAFAAFVARKAPKYPNLAAYLADPNRAARPELVGAAG